MKTMMNKILIAVLALVMILAMTGCSQEKDFIPDLSHIPDTGIAEVHFAEEIENFAEDSFNVIHLDSGEKEKMFRADFVLNHGGVCYTSDPSVATISSKGVVTAKGKGTCFVILIGEVFVGDRNVEIYKIVVDAPAGMRVGSLFDDMPKEFRAFAGIVGTMAVIIFAAVVAVIVVILVKVRKNNKTHAPSFTAPQSDAPTFDGPGFVNMAPGSTTTPGRFCHNCGEKTEGAFCPNCGTKLD